MKQNIYEYENYRELLKDFLEQKKQEDGKFSHRFFMQKIGIKSSGFLSEVISGKRSITDSHITKFVELLGLRGEDVGYFECLVRFNQAKHLDDRDYYFQKMLHCKPLELIQIQKSKYEYYSAWHHTAIRELLWFEKEKVNAAQIAKRLVPAISILEAEHSLELLLELGFVQKCELGYKVLDSLVSSSVETRAQEILKYQEVTLDLAKEALSGVSPMQRDISTVSFSLSPEGFAQMKELVENTRAKALKIAQQDSYEEKVYQLNIQLFPMSK